MLLAQVLMWPTVIAAGVSSVAVSCETCGAGMDSNPLARQGKHALKCGPTVVLTVPRAVCSARPTYLSYTDIERTTSVWGAGAAG